MDVKIGQYFNVIIEQQYNANGRFQKEYNVAFLQELQNIIKNFKQIVNVNIPTSVLVKRIVYYKCIGADKNGDYSGKIEILDPATKELSFFFVRTDVPTVDYLGSNILPKSKMKCKYDKNMPAYYENHHVLQPIRLLKPKKHIVVNQNSLQQLYPTATNAMPEKIKKFFEEPINLTMAHSGMLFKGRERC